MNIEQAVVNRLNSAGERTPWAEADKAHAELAAIGQEAASWLCEHLWLTEGVDLLPSALDVFLTTPGASFSVFYHWRGGTVSTTVCTSTSQGDRCFWRNGGYTGFRTWDKEATFTTFVDALVYATAAHRAPPAPRSWWRRLVDWWVRLW